MNSGYMTAKFVRSLSGALMLTGVFLLAPVFSAGAADADDEEVIAGKAIATKLCSRCHAIGSEGESSNKKAPPFRIFAEKWPLESLEEALAEGIVTGHPEMPEFKLPPDDVGALIVYLKSL